jgi:hypothetical protein
LPGGDLPSAFQPGSTKATDARAFALARRPAGNTAPLNAAKHFCDRRQPRIHEIVVEPILQLLMTVHAVHEAAIRDAFRRGRRLSWNV